MDEEGNSINYATDQDLEVQTCQLTSLVTFRVLARRVVADNNPGLASIFGVSKTEINLPLPYPAEGPLMPLFGLQYDDLVIPTGYGQTEWGVLGFAIASPLLALDGGDRCVQLTLKIASQSLRWLMASPLMLDRVKLPDYICQALEESLAWHYTTADRLVHLKPNARILSPGDEGHELLTIILEFKLHPSDPPWQVLPQRWSQPLLLAELLQMGVRRPAGDGVESEQTFYPLELLSLLHIAAISLDVAVEQHRPTQFHSSGGTLDPSQPLPIFGPSPVCGSLFSLSLADLVDKPLDAITLRLIWHGLPISRDGFRGHYSGYLLDVDGERYPPGDLFDNDSFRVDVQLQLAASFAPAATTLLQQPLFAVVPPEPPAASAPVPPSPLASATELTLTKLGGLVGVNGLRLVLRSPPYAFGDALYGINCLDASRRLASEIQSAQTSPKTPVGQPLSEASPGWPNPPWSPRVASVEVDYRCLQARLPEDHEPRMQWLHLRPLSEPEPVTTWSAVPLLPALLPHEAMEFLGPPSSADNLQVATVELVLSQRVRQISFLFGLTTNSTQTILPFTSALRVEAQVAGDVGPSAQWLTLGRDQVVDGTNGLRCTGILHLTLPDGKTSQQFRLQVIDVSTPEASLSSPHPFAQQLISSGPVLQCLEPNAVWATWEGPGGRNQLNRSLEAGKVTAALIKLPGIEQVRQPLPSIGGVAPATAELEKVCLCERLRHKNRALQPEDYALLLLRSFPSLWQVAVLPAQKASGESLPGTVTIIPIPGPDSPTIVDTTIPTCDPVLSERLLTALRSQVSPFVRLQIAPPPYRRICVKATVVVEDQMRMAMALQQLQKDLVRFLSPWPAPDLGARPKNYYEETAISQFIRDRHYIRSIDRLELEESPVEGDDKYTSAIDLSAAKRIERTGEVSSLCQSVRYYTSALHHKLDVKAANASKRFGREESNERR
ncbi:MAG: hypothetical protein VKO39_05730 [Cyanobacteriota bacterium]|nr:hypothetical protein [Cyanobacteriota bacterium]